MTRRTITVAHSPDSDDAFMFYALATGKIDTEELEIRHLLQDIESLNRAALEGVYEVSAVSFHAYTQLQDRYLLLPHGASIGKGYGPMIVARQPIPADSLTSASLAIPGKLTTAYLALKIYNPELDGTVVKFDEIIPSVLAGEYDAGLIIHEGQLTYSQDGLHKILDLGQWWQQHFSLPLPLGGNVIRRDLGPELISRVSQLLSRSIRYALDHRKDALAYAAQFSRGMDPVLMDNFVAMYVNDLTVDYSDEGRKAVQVLLDEAYRKGVLKARVVAEYAA